MSLTKAHITDNLFSKNLFTKTECAHIVDTIFELMKHALESGEEVMISGFGKFQVRRKNRRRGRNPHSGAPSGYCAAHRCDVQVLRDSQRKVDPGMRVKMTETSVMHIAPNDGP
jgi:integration host factor subunit alpha